MDNRSKIQKLSKMFHRFFSVLLVLIPICYFFYWTFINFLPERLITVNMDASPLIPHKISFHLQMIGAAACLLPLSALVFGILNLRKLFSYYQDGVIFSVEQVKIFKNISKALLLWAVLSIVYESIKSVLFSWGNPPGSRVLEVGLNSGQITSLIIGFLMVVIAWVMEEGSVLVEERELVI